MTSIVCAHTLYIHGEPSSLVDLESLVLLKHKHSSSSSSLDSEGGGCKV